MKWCILIAVISVVIVIARSFDEIHEEIHSKEFLNLVNSKAKTWKVGRNFHPHLPLPGVMKRIYNVDVLPRSSDRSRNFFAEIDIPDSFDSRQMWPNCSSISKISNQFHCGSCWAEAATGVMSDRYCIHSGQKKRFSFSANDMLSCCPACGSCDGGNYSLAFLHWKANGVVSGGDYGTEEGCSPYEITPEVETPKTPECKRKCQPKYKISYEKDKKFVDHAYSVAPEEIQMEIMTNGPVEAHYLVHQDFFLYKSGVYQYTHGKLLGGHAIRIIGWGVENETPYWLIANSWGYEFGEKGFFKILRGSNHLEIEQKVVTGMPKYNKDSR